MNSLFALDCSSNVPQKDFTRDITIVVAHRGPAMGLWMTLESCEAQLRDSQYKYSYVIVSNANDPKDVELNGIREHLEKSPTLLDWVVVPHAMSPPAARQLGTESADGQFIFFFDNHCIAAPGYFDAAIQAFNEYKADTVHSVTRFFIGEQEHLEYKLKLTTNFWAESRMEPRCSATKPYRIAAAGHGGFAVRRSTWEKLGGYGSLGLFEGYGAEELFWDLKLALHDGTNYLVPAMIHHHWSGNRPYKRHYSDDYFRNLMLCAYVIGGDKYLNHVYQFFEHSAKSGPTPIYHLYEEAVKRGSSAKKQMDITRLRTLDEQLELFRREGIPF